MPQSRFMPLRLSFSATILICTVLPLAGAQSSGSPLRRHYEEAQTFQQAGKLTEASDQYHAFISEALSQIGMGYSLAHDYKQAEAVFGEALRLEPESASLQLNAARAALMAGDLEKAKTLSTAMIGKAAGTKPQEAEAHQLLGRALLHQNQDRAARKELAAAVLLDPTFANGYDLAIVCLDLDDEKCAEKIFGDMEKSLGDTAGLHMAIGRAYGESDFQPRAVDEFREAIKEDPRLPGAHYLLAAALLGSGGDQKQVDAAEAALRQEIAISPNNGEAYAALGKLEANRNQNTKAAIYLKKAIALDPQTPDPCLFLGQMYFAEHRYADAEVYLRKSIALTTDPSRNRYQIQRAHFLLGRVLMRNGDTAGAQKQMQISRELANKALAQDRSKLSALLDSPASPNAAASPASPLNNGAVNEPALREAASLRTRLGGPIADSYNNLGAIAATRSNYDDAVIFFEAAAKWNPSMPGIDYNLGRASFAASRFANAIPPLSRYLASHRSDIGARSALGISQFETGDYQGCVETLNSIADHEGIAPQTEYVYAVSLIHTGKRASGIERLRALAKAHPEIPDVRRALEQALKQP